MEKINVLLVEDRDIIRDSLKVLIDDYEGIHIKAEATNGIEALSKIKSEDFDVILMDINMPEMDGFEATKKILELKPETKILAYSFHQNPFYIKEMIKAGVSGYITKGEGKEAYHEAIKSIMDGKRYFSKGIKDSMLGDYVNLLKLCS